MIGPGGLTGVPKYAAPASGNGTVTVDAGGILHFIIVHASLANATVRIFGGPTIAVPNGASPTLLQYFHTLYQATAAAAAIIGVNTDMLMVHWIRPGHAGP